MKRPKVKELREAVASTRRYTYPHRPRTDYYAIARRAALSFLVILITAALLTALYDIGVQVTRSNRSSKISDLVLTLGSYVAVILIGISIMISRRFALSNEYTSIPKRYIPIQSTDVPETLVGFASYQQPAFELISSEYDRVAVISHISQPRHRTQQGWGRPGQSPAFSRFEYDRRTKDCFSLHSKVHHTRTFISAPRSSLPSQPSVSFKTAGPPSKIRPLLNLPYPAIASLNPPTIPETTLSTGPLSIYRPSHSRSSTLSPLGPLIRSGVLPPPIVAVAEAYEQILQRARYGIDEPTEKEYDDMVRYVAVLMGILERIGAVKK
ncbi:BQ2448_1638 [Microbotryum intermedium]|uniref:Defect at low temperature protein 1 n=1 Tax=Microbotryum intermedium TaxID=269621 RepID=A0A238FED8_9BASI|nr:BQ2448_1638 [Microbotryum intermedium]